MANTPSGPNYGTDLSVTPNANGILDIQPTLQYATGINVLVQSLICRQMCVRGTVIDAPNEGIDLRSYLRSGLTQAQLSDLPAVVQKELQRDQRVKSVTVTGNFNTETNTLTMNETITPVTGSPFSLTLAVSSVTVTLLNLSTT